MHRDRGGFAKNNDQQVAIASYTFIPPVSPVAPVPMLHAVPPDSFKQNLVNVTFIQTDPATTVLLVDSLRYRLNRLVLPLPAGAYVYSSHSFHYVEYGGPRLGSEFFASARFYLSL